MDLSIATRGRPIINLQLASAALEYTYMITDCYVGRLPDCMAYPDDVHLDREDARTINWTD